MEVGNYVRTKDGRISIIEDIDRNGLYILKDYNYSYKNDWLIKSSPNIIDLIEVGDYVNGLKVVGVNNEIKGFGTIIFSKDSSIMEDYIYSIVTREMFESMEYKVGD